MSIAQSLLPEFDQEMANTRKALERLPEDKLEWKPDPKSMTLGRLAGHVAEMPNWAAMTVSTESLDINPGGKRSFEAMVATSREQVLEVFDKNVADARKAIEGVSDQALMENWRLLSDGHEILSMPRAAVLRSLAMNHLIHHRGQLTVYYRLVGVAVPGMYGPSADESQAAAV
jgi:uncharacterized damage-inducible protein DinB